jgi:hypothetical protein
MRVAAVRRNDSRWCTPLAIPLFETCLQEDGEHRRDGEDGKGEQSDQDPKHAALGGRFHRGLD